MKKYMRYLIIAAVVALVAYNVMFGDPSAAV
jgi:hypothetical protein